MKALISGSPSKVKSEHTLEEVLNYCCLLKTLRQYQSESVEYKDLFMFEYFSWQQYVSL